MYFHTTSTAKVKAACASYNDGHRGLRTAQHVAYGPQHLAILHTRCRCTGHSPVDFATARRIFIEEFILGAQRHATDVSDAFACPDAHPVT